MHFFGKRKTNRCLKASVTVEAALALPIFLFAMTSLLFLTEIGRCQLKVSGEMADCGRMIASYGYAAEHLSEGELAEAAGAGAQVMTSAYVTGRINSALEEDRLLSDLVMGGAVCDPFRVDGGDHRICLRTWYILKIPVASFGIFRIPVSQEMVFRSWSGYTGDGEGPAAEDDPYVYITETGTVYHTDRSCTHLSLSITDIPLSGVAAARNADGGKYYPCERCMRGAAPGHVYIASTGDRYHSSRFCSGLKRTIRRIRLSETGGRPPCSRCSR